MSLLIKGVEMPDERTLWIVVHPDGTVEHNEWNVSGSIGWQTLRQSAVPIPPCGRLIDADLLMEEAKRISGPITGDGWDNYGVYGLIERQPTVIEAEVSNE